MKQDIHPAYHKDAKVTCSCGAVFTVGSTMPSFEIEICSLCHPFYTGEEKVIDTAGRVDKFKQRREKAKTLEPKKKKVAQIKKVQKSEVQKRVLKEVKK